MATVSGQAITEHRKQHLSKKQQICEHYVSKLRKRNGVDFVVDDALIQAVRAHFNGLPTLYAVEINVDGLDVLVSSNMCLSWTHEPPQRPGYPKTLAALPPSPAAEP